MDLSVIAAYLVGGMTHTGRFNGRCGPIVFSYDKSLGLPSIGRASTPDGPPGIWLTAGHDAQTTIGFLAERLAESEATRLCLKDYTVKCGVCEGRVFRVMEPMWQPLLNAKFLPTQVEPGDGSDADLQTFRASVESLQRLSVYAAAVRIRNSHPLLSP